MSIKTRKIHYQEKVEKKRGNKWKKVGDIFVFLLFQIRRNWKEKEEMKKKRDYFGIFQNQIEQ